MILPEEGPQETSENVKEVDKVVGGLGSPGVDTHREILLGTGRQNNHMPGKWS